MTHRPETAAARDEHVRPHPRTLGWLGTTALAMGGSNQSIFLIGALLAATKFTSAREQGSKSLPENELLPRTATL